SPKACVIVDGGGHLHLDGVAADLRLRAIGSRAAPRLHVAMGGDARSATALGTIQVDGAPEVAVRLFKLMAAHGTAARAADLIRTAGAHRLPARLRGFICAAPAPPPTPISPPLGLHPPRPRSLAPRSAAPPGHAT